MMWEQVQQKLHRLARQDTAFKAPCSSSHRYRLKPVATEAEVESVEGRYGVRLPDDYREYVLKLANGGAGPYHGIYPVGYYEYLGEWHPWGEGPFAISPATPFALREAWNLPAAYMADTDADVPLEAKREAVECLARAGISLPQPSGKVVGKNPFTDEPIVETIDVLITNAAYSNDLMNGTIPIATQGCNLGVSLVVSGAERGSIWYDLRADSEGIVPASRPGSPRLTFSEWYDAWLNDSLVDVRDK